MQPNVQTFFDEPTHTFSYVAWDPDTGAAAVLDAVLGYDAASGRTRHDGADAVIAFVRAQGLWAEWVIDTHVHAGVEHARDRLRGRSASAARQSAPASRRPPGRTPHDTEDAYRRAAGRAAGRTE